MAEFGLRTSLPGYANNRIPAQYSSIMESFKANNIFTNNIVPSTPGGSITITNLVTSSVTNIYSTIFAGTGTFNNVFAGTGTFSNIDSKGYFVNGSALVPGTTNQLMLSAGSGSLQASTSTLTSTGTLNIAGGTIQALTFAGFNMITTNSGHSSLNIGPGNTTSNIPAGNLITLGCNSVNNSDTSNGGILIGCGSTIYPSGSIGSSVVIGNISTSGNNTFGLSNGVVVVGNGSTGEDQATVVGSSAQGLGSSVVIGANARGNATDAITIGRSAGTNAVAAQSITIGRSAAATGVAAIALGSVVSQSVGAFASAERSIAIGSNARATATGAIAIGQPTNLVGALGAQATGVNSISIGTNAQTSGNGISLGNSTSVIPANTVGLPAGFDSAGALTGDPIESILITVGSNQYRLGLWAI